MIAESVLRKHVAIIHAYSMMTVLQRKIFNVLLYQAVKQQEYCHEKKSIAIECIMSFSELMKAINFNSNNTQYLKESVDALASVKIEWNLLKDKVPLNISFLNLRVIHGSPTFFQDGTFNFSFHKFMLECIGNPNVYGTVDIALQAEFESKYGHSLYENSTRFVNMQKGKVIQLDTFRRLLGVSSEKYSTMRELTRNVIKPAVDEVNDRSEFVVELNPMRAGRKVTGFELIVNPKHKCVPKNNNMVDEVAKKLLGEITKNFGKVNELVLRNILKNYSHEYIIQKITYTKQHAKKDKTGLYPIAYFISALKNDYKNTEQLILENKDQCERNDDERQWQKRLEFLRTDLANWKRNLQTVDNTKDPALIENINKIIIQCQKSLKEHLLSKPENSNSDKVG